MSTLENLVQAPEGEVMILTKTSYLLFGNKPRTSIMPQGLGKFGRQMGFQAVYNTSDPQILQVLHHLWVAVIMGDGYQVGLAGAKRGVAEFPPEGNQLRGYVARFLW